MLRGDIYGVIFSDFRPLLRDLALQRLLFVLCISHAYFNLVYHYNATSARVRKHKG